MRIGIDARMIDWSGIGRYTESLITGIKEFVTGIEPVLFCNQSNSHRISDSITFKRHYINTSVFSLDAPIRLAGKLKPCELELYHSPHFVVPSGKATYPIVVTIHDLIPLIIKRTMPNALYRRYYYLINRLACRKATKIIAPSQSTKNDIERILGVPGDKIEVIYEGVHSMFRKTSEKQVGEIKEKFAIKGGYIFALGNQKPNKGIEYLIDAFYKLMSGQGLKHELVLIGSPSDKFKGVRSRITRYGLEHKVRFIGKVTDDELIALYNGASVFVFPSLYEGFGLPPLEAMACEVPVVASNKSSMPEVVGDAALTVDPCQVDELANAIVGAIEDENLRSRLVGHGLKRVRDFSLEKFTKETVMVYKQALEKT
ncbi:MAG: glycosyltransferase family 4 protein [Actinobacteria bacterium]|nr:glycosyltransferase family 4 protein [Actinomycetota bacterium]